MIAAPDLLAYHGLVGKVLVVIFWKFTDVGYPLQTYLQNQINYTEINRFLIRRRLLPRLFFERRQPIY